MPRSAIRPFWEPGQGAHTYNGWHHASNPSWTGSGVGAGRLLATEPRGLAYSLGLRQVRDLQREQSLPRSTHLACEGMLPSSVLSLLLSSPLRIDSRYAGGHQDKEERQGQLGHILPSIRWPMMDSHFLNDVVAQASWLQSCPSFQVRFLASNSTTSVMSHSYAAYRRFTRRRWYGSPSARSASRWSWRATTKWQATGATVPDRCQPSRRRSWFSIGRSSSRTAPSTTPVPTSCTRATTCTAPPSITRSTLPSFRILTLAHSYCELSREGDKIGFFICIHPYPSDETDADDDDADAMQSCFVHFKAIAKVVGRNREIAYTRYVDPTGFGALGPSVVFGHVRVMDQNSVVIFIFVLGSCWCWAPQERR